MVSDNLFSFALRFILIPFIVIQYTSMYKQTHTVYQFHLVLIGLPNHLIFLIHLIYIQTWGQGCGNIEPTAGHFGLFLPLLSCSPYTLYTVQFHFTGHLLDLSDNVLHDWLFPHPCMGLAITEVLQTQL